MSAGLEFYQSKFSVKKEKQKKPTSELKAKKVLTACTYCRKRHIKCNGGLPTCSNCEKFKKTCFYKEADKKVNLSVDQIETLQDTVMRLTNENNKLHMSLKELLASKESGTPDYSRIASDFDRIPISKIVNGKSPESRVDNSLGDSILSPANQAYPYLTPSGHILNSDNLSKASNCFPSKSLFDIELRKLIKHFKNGNKEFSTHGAFNDYLDPSRFDFLNIERENLLTITIHIPTTSHSDHSITLELPEFVDAVSLIQDSVLFNCGCLYFFNEGLLFESLKRLYNEKSIIPELVYSKKGLKQNNLTLCLMLCKMMLIFALGDALKNEPTNLLENKYFAKASEMISLLFGSVELQNCAEEGGIEILLLLAYYIQVLDQTTNSSLILGIAVKAITILGIHVDNGKKVLSKPELEHRRRLLWTAYILERILATNNGLPLSINDESITAELPHNLNPVERERFYTFSDAEMMRQYILISKLGAEVLKKLYTNKPKKNILPIVHELAVKLLRWKKGLPDYITYDYNKPVVKVSRHVTLLMAEYFQGLNLAVRHLLFHFTFLQISSNDKKYMDLSDSSFIISALLNASFQASMNSIRSFYALAERNEIPLQGCMEREYLYTSIVNLVLFNISFGVYQATNVHIDHAISVLIDMHKIGNKSATLRIVQVLILIKNLDFGLSMTSILEKYSSFNGADSSKLFHESEDTGFQFTRRNMQPGYDSILDFKASRNDGFVSPLQSFNRHKSEYYSGSPQSTNNGHQDDNARVVAPRKDTFTSPALGPQLTSLEELLSDFVSLSSTSGAKEVGDLWDEEIFAWN